LDKSNASNKKLENALDYSLKLLNSGASIEECLKLYPNQRKELKGLLEAASCVKSAYPDYPELRPSKLYAKTARAQFLSAIEGGIPAKVSSAGRGSDTKKEAATPRLFNIGTMFRRAHAVAAAAAAALLIATGGLVHASGSSMPGSPFYGVKRAAESVQLTLAFDAESKAKLHYEFAQRRIEEAKKMAIVGQDDKAASVFKEAKNNLEEAKKVAKVVPPVEQSKIEREIEELTSITKEPSGKGVIPSDTTETTDTGKSKSDTKVAVNTESASLTQGDPALASKRQKGTGTEGASSGNRSLASLVPFEIGNITLSDRYISPNGDGVKDTVSISISGATEDNFKVELYRGATMVAVIAEKLSGNVEIDWDGKDVEGNKVPDGEYVIRVSNTTGQLAHSKAKLIVDATPPSITLIEPPANVVTNTLKPRFVWQANEDIESYSLKLSLDGAEREYQGITNNFFMLESGLMPGNWSWSVTATDRAGNTSTSEVRSIRLVRDEGPKESSATPDSGRIDKK